MSPHVRAGLEEWLRSGTDAQKRHARIVLGVADRPPSYPPAIVQAGNALGAAAAFILDGFRTADDAEQARRLAICHACEHYDASQHRCRACGCFADLKARVASSSCPHHKWESK